MLGVTILFPQNYVQSQANSLQGKSLFPMPGFPPWERCLLTPLFGGVRACNECGLILAEAGRTQAGHRMEARGWTKSSARTALLLIAGVGTFGCAYAQQPAATGSLTGKLTDAHSSPLENVTVTLRNAATGAAVQTTTAHHGRYRFTALAQGEYTLTASGPSGTGQVNAIYIASGHESQVQTAIVFHPQRQEGAANVPITESAARQPHQTPSLKFPSTPKLDVVTPVAEASLSPEKLVLLPLNGTRSIQPEAPLPTLSGSVAGQPVPKSPALPTSSSSNALIPSLDVEAVVATNIIPVIAAPNIPAGAIAQAVLATELGPIQASILTTHRPRLAWPGTAQFVPVDGARALGLERR